MIVLLVPAAMLAWGAYTSYFDRHPPAEWIAYTAALGVVTSLSLR